MCPQIGSSITYKQLRSAGSNPVGAANSKRFGLDVILKRSRRCLPDSCKGSEDLLRIRPCVNRGDFVLIYTFCAWKSSASGYLVFALNRMYSASARIKTVIAAGVWRMEFARENVKMSFMAAQVWGFLETGPSYLCRTPTSGFVTYRGIHRLRICTAKTNIRV